MRRALIILLAAVALLRVFAWNAAHAADSGPALDAQDWSWQSVTGRYDQGQLRRGYQVFSEICAGCHGLQFVAYRNLAELGFSDKQIKEIAAEKDVPIGADKTGCFVDDKGVLLTRPALPTDKFVAPFYSEAEAREANGGALPPDLSLMTKSHKNGADYVYSLMTGYLGEAPEGEEQPPEGKYYNTYFPGHHISMPPPLFDEAVTYEDGAPASLEQHARDVVAFLNWAADPKLGERHALGLKVMMFLAVMTLLFYLLKKHIWRNVRCPVELEEERKRAEEA